MRFLRGAGMLLAAWLPLVLLGDLGANFYYDWHNHQWFVGYFGEYFRQHGAMPQVLNAAQITGMPQPIFYGWLFYPTLGFVSAVTGAALALRIAAALALAFQFWAIYAAGRRTLRERGASFLLAAAIGWGIYLFTNFYNRAALTEFLATTFLATAVAFGVAAGTEPGHALAKNFAWLAVAFGALAAGAHPPTALVGAMLAALLLPVAAIWFWRERKTSRHLGWTSAVAVTLGGGALAPWIYANVVLHSDLFILAKLKRFAYFPDRTENWLGRFAPFPHDGGSLMKGAEISTPYAEAQIGWPLMLFVAWNLIVLWRVRRTLPAPESLSCERAMRWLAVVGLAWFAWTASMSLSRTVEDAFRWLAPYMQFPTRFVSHANLALLLAALATGALIAARGGYERFRASTSAVVGAALGIAAIGIAIKLTHAAVVREHTLAPQYTWGGNRAALVSAGRPDAASDYAAMRALPQLMPRTVAAAKKVEFPVGERGGKFGVVGELKVDLAQEQWVVTNATIFRWGHLFVDGSEPPKTAMAGNDFRIAVKLPPGAHTLRWEWRPDAVWSALHTVATWALALLLVGMALATWCAVRLEWTAAGD